MWNVLVIAVLTVVMVIMVMMVMVIMVMVIMVPPRVPQRHQSALARGDTDCPPRLQIKMLNIIYNLHNATLFPPPLLLMISSSRTLLPEDFCTPGKTNKNIIILISSHLRGHLVYVSELVLGVPPLGNVDEDLVAVVVDSLDLR